MNQEWGVLLMAFGAVGSPDDVEEYYTRIRGGRTPTQEEVADLRTRYERIGGRSPLVGITRRQARALEEALRRKGHAVPVRAGMRFWDPSIEDALQDLVELGARRVVALTMGPYDSRISVGGYQRALDAAHRRVDASLDVTLVRQWYDAPGLESAWRHRFHEALEKNRWSADSARVLFSAHALPERILLWNDPYPRQFFDHGSRLAAAWRLSSWGFTYQSAGAGGGQRWMGPDVLDALADAKDLGDDRVLVVPIGFSADHLEILHDLDYEARSRASELGIGFARTPSLNHQEAFVEALADTASAHLGDRQPPKAEHAEGAPLGG